MLVAMSSSKCQDLVMEEVQNDQYILHIKLDLSSQEVNCFGDNISMSVFRDVPSFKDNLVTQALKHWALGKTLEFEKIVNLSSTMDDFLLILTVKSGLELASDCNYPPTWKTRAGGGISPKSTVKECLQLGILKDQS